MRIFSLLTRENGNSPTYYGTGEHFHLESESHEYSSERGHLFRRSEPRRRQRAGRRASGADRAERHRQPPQPHRDRRRHHLADRTRRSLPTHIELCRAASCGLPRDSVVLLEQIRTLDKSAPARAYGASVDDARDGARRHGAIAVSFGLSGGRPGGTIPQ